MEIFVGFTFPSADVTSGDGIYSGPVLRLPPDLTWWTYVIEVRNQSGIIDAGMYNRHPSSGSSIPVSDPVTLGPFSRFAYGHSIRLAESYEPNGIVSKPGRIRDLQITSFADYQVNLTWTAPKANYGTSSDSGSQIFLYFPFES